MANYKSNLQTNNTSLSANNTDLQSLIEQANALPDATDGVELPTLTNEGTAADLLSGKQLIDQEGNVVTGTIATNTARNLTASGATVTVPAGYYASQATKSVSTATQATPSITVSSSGKITAKSTQSAGYVSSGTKSATKQLTTQAAKTITPSTSSQTAVASGVYTTGAVTVEAIPSTYVKPTATKAATTYTPTTTNQTIASGTYLSGTQTIKGDANLVASNIKSGVSIFGVTGTLSSSAGENLDEELATQDTLIASLQSKLDGNVSGYGASVKTCTLTIEYDGIDNIEYTGITNGNIEIKQHAVSFDGNQITDILENSLFIVSCSTNITKLIGDNILQGNLVLSGSTNMYLSYTLTGDCTITGGENTGIEDW